MTNHELDAAIAEALGARTEPVCMRQHRTDDAEYDSVLDEYSGWCYTCAAPISERPRVAPTYSTDPVAADALMRVLRERGLCIVLDIDERPAATVMREGCADCDVFEAAGDTWTQALAKAALSALTAGKENVDG